MGLGAFTLAIAVLAFLGWVTFLVNQSRVRRRRESAPANLTPFVTDDEMESKRLNGVLVAALVVTALLAIVMPVYYLNESSRQEAAAHKFDEIAVERGEHWYEEFGCGDCHGDHGGGGGAPWVEARSGLSTVWVAPALDDILFRFDDDEVRYWLVWGRQGSPMPGWGVEGGGPLNSQQIDELIAFLDYIAVDQMEAVGKAEGAIARELTRLADADANLDEQIEDQRAEIAALLEAPDQYAVVQLMPSELKTLLTGAGTCTDETAAAVGQPCSEEGVDADRDGVTDTAEVVLNDLVARIIEIAPPSDATGKIDDLLFDPANPFTTSAGTTVIPDLDQVEVLVAELDTVARDLRLTVDGLDTLMATAEAGLAFLEDARSARRYAIDLEQIATEAFGGNVAEAQRAAGLYNAYCARCHTAGYSAGIAYTQEAGSGAMGPSLREGRSVVQFPDLDEHVDFIIRGSENGQAYGVNGIGRGWMPGFGAVLSRDDITLIAEFERVLP